jgi:hypothetical protein
MSKKVEKEVALNDLETFVNKWKKKPVDSSELEESYPDVLEGIMDGLLVFNEEQVPTYRLKHPIKDDKGEVAVTDITFITRILPSQVAACGSGIDLKKDTLKFQLALTAFVIGKTPKMLDKFSAYDYDVISQVASVFT